jgi:magnesium chelatase family protein
MLSRVYSVGTRGVEGYPVLVELDLANGLPGFTTVGLPDSAVREARERVASAVRNSGFKFPARRITVNLAPAQRRKNGTQFDLPIALAVLSASGQARADEAWSTRYCFIGELSLDGSLKPVSGALSMALKAKEQGFEAIVVPDGNAQEVSVSGMKAFSARKLGEVVSFINGDGALTSVSGARSPASSPVMAEDLGDLKGQTIARRALEIAAAGCHNMIMIGPPGVGKSMLARRLTGILPPLTEGEALEATRVHAACGRPGLVAERPFRAPHHSASTAALIGGGPSCRPGEAALAHAGVLFLDEMAEFRREALEALRQPLEEHKVTVARAHEVLEYPARFQLIGASNPCPCGLRAEDGQKGCACSPQAMTKYLGRLSGPLLDRVDLHLMLGALDFEAWSGGRGGETSAEVRRRVVRARELQRERFGREDFAVNAYLPSAELHRHCAVDAAGLGVLELAARRGASARGLDRCLRVARTIADLAGSAAILREHVVEAVQLRGLDKENALC